ncbi:unnamed protein product, partial [Iphiclides podalirius]
MSFGIAGPHELLLSQLTDERVGTYNHVTTNRAIRLIREDANSKRDTKDRERGVSKQDFVEPGSISDPLPEIKRCVCNANGNVTFSIPPPPPFPG